MLPTLSVIIPAYNEEENIKKCLKSIIAQQSQNFILKDIILVIDGGVDKTAEKAKELRDSRIKIIKHLKNLGVSEVINTALSMIESDYIIKVDGDTVFFKKEEFDNMIKKSHSTDASLIFGKQTYRKPNKTLLQKYIYTVHNNIYKEKLLPFLTEEKFLQHHVLGIYLIRKDMYKNLHIPADIVAEDVYIFYATKKAGFFVDYRSEPGQYFNYPNSWRHHITQLLRWTFSLPEDHFSKKFLDSYNQPFPKNILLPILSRLFFKHPLYFTILFLTRTITYLYKPFYKNKRAWGSELQK